MMWRHRRPHLMEKVSTSPDIELLYPVFCSECGRVAACQCWAATCRHSRYLVIRNICFKCVITYFFLCVHECISAFLSHFETPTMQTQNIQTTLC